MFIGTAIGRTDFGSVVTHWRKHPSQRDEQQKDQNDKMKQICNIDAADL